MSDTTTGFNGTCDDDLNHIHDYFHEWFNQLEGFGYKSERFYNDLEIQDELRRSAIMVNWMNAAFYAGYDKGKENASCSSE